MPQVIEIPVLKQILAKHDSTEGVAGSIAEEIRAVGIEIDDVTEGTPERLDRLAKAANAVEALETRYSTLLDAAIKDRHRRIEAEDKVAGLTKEKEEAHKNLRALIMRQPSYFRENRGNWISREGLLATLAGASSE